ncbi:MAG: C2H2-type zinc finger protein [Candidatus Nitrosotenuis sp.]|jgi:KRAB domain-containing zinc finger protein
MNLFWKKNPCEKCNLKFKTIEELMQHKQIVHGKEYLYDCKKCEKSFTNMNDMRTHLQKFHSYKNN